MTKSQSCFRTLVCSFAVLALSGPTLARACETTATARPDSECVVMARQGANGVWFSLTAADKLRAAFRLVPELQLQLEKYSEVDDARAREAANLREALAAQKRVSDELKQHAALSDKAALAALDDATRAQVELDSWWRSPVAWGCVGALAGVLATLVATGR